MSPKKRLSVSEIEAKIFRLDESLKKMSLYGFWFLSLGFPLVILPLFGLSGWFGLGGVAMLIVASVLLFMVDPVEREIDHLKLDLRTTQGRINYMTRRGLAAPPGTNPDE